ncbi:hypothetical protein ClosIBUN13A_CONTIG172g02672 [Clostridium sp. IBUN13A]|nr:hypothetical protein ClosIBUN125C_CONTIG40g02342 [Clostridium sp. IBUN125C]KJZ89696.1 hypothetical protein ClosIBUN62F_CONTIG57g02120 [Clostridium sp. IBUN62F]KJZ95883.1 hypothetical protein ClosIBUN13A_CONTIG172g02672 [Clostridium sp. IBUN13A]KJZ96331.1 hypothetical protein ClosIBUN22A_CONTIG116g02392 [Clostridium sp. IBUN22A]
MTCSYDIIVLKIKGGWDLLWFSLLNASKKYYITIFIVISLIVSFSAFNMITIDRNVQASYVKSRVKGINISNNDGNLDLSSVTQAGGKYVYLKATEGATFRDSYMDTYYNQCKDLGMKIGVYHYLVNTSSPEEQAENFYNTISKYNWDLIPMLDTEVYFDGLEDYIKRFKIAFNKLSPLKLGIYSYTSFIDKYLNNADSEIYEMPLWEANYNGKPWSSVGDNKFINLVGHQYSTEKHISDYIGDFNGDLNEFNEGCLINQ